MCIIKKLKPVAAKGKSNKNNNKKIPFPKDQWFAYLK